MFACETQAPDDVVRLLVRMGANLNARDVVRPVVNAFQLVVTQ
jgi:hypothetical protein